MATYSRPGVYVQEVSLPQSVQLANVSQAVGAMAGWLGKGSTTAPVLVSSWSDFVKNFGSLNDSYPTTWSAYNFFANGGRQLYVQRLAGTGATSASLSIKDSLAQTLTPSITAASNSSGTLTYTSVNQFAAGQSVVITGLGLTATPTLTGATASGTGASTTITFTTGSTTGIVVGSVVTISGVTGTTALNDTWYVSAVVAGTSFTAATATPGSITVSSPVFTSATVSVSSGYNRTGTIIATGLSGTQFSITPTVAASVTLPSASLTSQTTGVATGTTVPNTVFGVTAINPGSWANNYGIQIVSGGSSSTFGLNIYSTSGTTYTLVESFTDLSMSSSDRGYIRTVINSFSSYITIDSANFDSTKSPYKLSTTPTLFSSGTSGVDGTQPSRTDYYNTNNSPATGAWTNFDVINNPLVMYAPDAAYASQVGTLTTSNLHGDAILYAASRDDAFVVIDTPSGLSTTAAQANVTSSLAVAANVTNGGICAAYYPWINIPDGTKVSGATRLQAPGAAVVGQYLATDASRGVFKTPAGLGNGIALAVSTEHLFTNSELDTLNTSTDPVNAIRQVPGAGIVIMGGRTMDNTATNRYISIRRSLIYIEKKMKDLSAFAIFENNDSRLWSQVRTALNSFLLDYWQQGGLRGTSPTQAYYVKIDESTTTFSDIQNGRMNIEVGVALQYPTEFIVIKLGQLTGNATA